MATTLERLTVLQYHATRYELVVEHTTDGRRYRIGYTARKGRAGLFDMVRINGSRLVALTGDEGITFGKRAGDACTMGDWRIRFTGRTQREAIVEGELPWLGTLD